MATLVGSFQGYKNRYDMNGNVAEWVEDCSHRNYSNAPNNDSAWKTQCANITSRDEKVIRGGSWLYRAKSIRSASREFKSNTARNRAIGFRIAMDN